MLLARGFSYSRRPSAPTRRELQADPGQHAARSRCTATPRMARCASATSPIRCMRPTRWAARQADPARAAEVHWASDGDMVRTAYALRPDDDDWGQAGTLVREVLDDEARDRLGAQRHRSCVRGCEGAGAVPGVRVLAQRRPRPRQRRSRKECAAQPTSSAKRHGGHDCGRLAVSRHCAPAGMIDSMSIDVIYTAESTASGGGRDGHVKSSDNRIDLDTRPPKEAGGSGEGTNPEQLFSAGYAACFLGALQLVARTEKIALDSASGVTAQVGFGKDDDGGYGINAHLIGYLPGPGAGAGRGADEQGAPGVPVLQGHPRQHRRHADRQGLRRCAPLPRRLPRWSAGVAVRMRRSVGSSVGSGRGVLRRAGQGFGRQHRRRPDDLGSR